MLTVDAHFYFIFAINVHIGLYGKEYSLLPLMFTGLV